MNDGRTTEPTPRDPVRVLEGDIIPPPKVRNLLPGSYARSNGETMHLMPHPDGVLAEIRFRQGRGGGAVIGRDLDHAAQLAAEIVKAHEEGRDG